MFRSIMVLVALVGLFGSHLCDDQRDAIGRIHFIQPTFDVGRSRIIVSQPILTMMPNKLSVELKPDIGMIGFEETQESSQQLDNAAAVAWLRNYSRENEIGSVTYADERRRLAALSESSSSNFWLGTTACHQSIIPRALEAFKADIDKKYIIYTLSFDDGIGGCLIRYKDNIGLTKQGLFDPSAIDSSYRLTSVPVTRYKIAALWASTYTKPDDPSIPMFAHILDEAGFLYEARFDLTKLEWTKIIELKSLSSIDLEQKDLQINFNYTTPYLSGNFLQVVQNLGNNAVENLMIHYRHAFVESITLFEGTLCWTRGVGPNRAMSLLTCYGDTLGVPRSIMSSQQTSESIRAVELYEYNDRYYFHAIFVKMGAGLIENNMVNYQRFVGDSPQELANYEFPSASNENRDKAFQGKLASKRVPIDLVYLPECERLVAFYPNSYTLHKPDEMIQPLADVRPTYPRLYIVNWMDYPVNAVLYARRRLYLFISGNQVIVTKMLNARRNNCGLDQVEFEESYASSILLLTFIDSMKGTKQSELWPVYDSRLAWKEGKWSRDLRSVKSMKIEHVIHYRKSEPPTTPGPNTNVTGGPTPKPASRSGNTLSIIIVIVIVVIVIGIFVGFIYYFCCSTPDEPLRQPKSVLRKQKTVSLGRGRSPTAPGAPAAGQTGGLTGPGAAGSTLHAAPTLRSNLSKQNSAGGQNSKDSKQADPTKRLEPTSSAKSIRSPQKSPRSPKSAKSIRSVKSRSPGPTARSPRTKTVGSMEPTGSKRSPSVTSPSTSRTQKM